MEQKLLEFVKPEQALTILVVLFLVGYFIYKEWPEFKKRVSSKAVEDHKDKEQDRTVESRLDSIETDVKEIKDKLNRDYYRINEVERRQAHDRKIVSDMLEEQGIIMRALLGTLGGLQELGANGPTKAAEQEILGYLNKQAHRSEQDGE